MRAGPAEGLEDLSSSLQLLDLGQSWRGTGA